MIKNEMIKNEMIKNEILSIIKVLCYIKYINLNEQIFYKYTAKI